jgi:hypothetical protein
MTPLRIFVGYDSREPVAYHVLASSILRRATIPVSIAPLVQPALRAAGLYTRQRGSTESTEFSLTRFLVPCLAGFVGYAVFMDCDMLALVDLQGLAGEIERQADRAVLVCPHDYTPKQTTKFLGQTQTVYPRKNWSSLMVFNADRCRSLTPEYVNTASGLELHRFCWVPDDAIGSLPLEWNYLVGEPGQADAPPKILHYTNGGPWFKETWKCDYAEEWLEEYHRAIGIGLVRGVAV